MVQKFRIAAGGEGEHRGKNRNVDARLANQAHRLGELLGIEHQLCHHEHGPGGDFALELVDLELQVLEIRVEPAADVEAGGLMNARARVVDAAVEVGGDLDQPDAVEVVDARGAGLVAQLGGVAGDD